MYRERKEHFTVPANTTVEVLKHGAKQTLVRLPKAAPFNGWMTMIDNANLPAFRGIAKPAKGKKAAEAPVVAAEGAEQPAAPIAAEAQAPVEAAQPVAEQAI